MSEENATIKKVQPQESSPPDKGGEDDGKDLKDKQDSDKSSESDDNTNDSGSKDDNDSSSGDSSKSNSSDDLDKDSGKDKSDDKSGSDKNQDEAENLSKDKNSQTNKNPTDDPAEDKKSGKGGKDDKGGKSGLKDTLKKAQATATVASAGAKGVMAMKAIMLIKKFLAMLMAMMQAIIQAIAGVIAAIVQVVTAVLTTVATALGVGLAVAAVIVFGPFALLAIVVVAAVAATSDSNQAVYDSAPVTTETCAEQAYDAVYDMIEGDDGTFSNQAIDNAQKITSVLYQVGYKDSGDDAAIIMIGAILGNWQTESTIDPSIIEYPGSNYSGNYGAGVESYTYGEAKKTVMNDFSNYSQKIAQLPKHNESGYIYENQYWCGLGLGQWTGPRCYDFLKYADTNGLAWYSLDANLQYLLHENLKDLINWGKDSGSCPLNAVDPSSSSALHDATHDFMANWEGVSWDEDSRKANADKWVFYVKGWISGNDINSAYAASIIGAANAASNDASDQAISNMMGDCASFHGKYDNSNAAAAMLSMSYLSGYESETVTGNAEYDITAGVGSVGSHMDVLNKDSKDPKASEFKQLCTGTYLDVKDALIEAGQDNSIYYSSCDRGVTTALRWSGTDDDSTWGGAQAAGDSLALDTEHWDSWTWDRTFTSLEPGDVLYSSEHILMYVGYGTKGGLVESKWKDRVSETAPYICHASYGDRGIKCADGAYLSTDGMSYTVCRNKKKESEPKFVTIMDGKSAKDDVKNEENSTESADK